MSRWRRVLCAAVMVLGSLSGGSAFAQELKPSRGLFVSVIQDPPVLCDRAAISKLVEFSRQARIQTLFVQVYRSGRSWFKSGFADDFPYQASVKTVGTDPLELLIEQAHTSGIEVHAWLNLLSLSANTRSPILKRFGPGILTRGRAEPKTLAGYRIDNQYFLEPSDPRVRQELAVVVTELARAYPKLDGIMFDYVRYPDVHPDHGYAPDNVEKFKAATPARDVRPDDPAWRDWKRRQVTEFLDAMVRAAKAVNPGLKISATGCMPVMRALEEAFQDWPSWVKSGRVDAVTVMSYTKDQKEFERYVSSAAKTAGGLEKLDFAVAAYKLVGSWQAFRRQWEFCERSGAHGCVALHYGSLIEDPGLARALKKGR